MLKLSKKVEYGILATQYIATKNGETVSAKEIAERMELSFDFLSKTLQALMKNGIISSQQGIHGGYKLSKSPDQISLTDIIHSLEERITIVNCLSPGDESCDKMDNCTLRNPFHVIQLKIDDLFTEMTIQHLLPNNDKLYSLDLSIKGTPNG